jgi:Flp pilus assembly protein TadG
VRLRDEGGAAVAEFAVALPAAILVFVTMLGGVSVAAAQLRAQDAAADVARSWARGDSAGVVAARLNRQVPGARATRSARGDLVCATVRVPPPGPLARSGLTAKATACALSGGR